MRTRHSRLEDLQRVFEEHITVGMISEAFASFDSNSDPNELKEFMRQKKYDVIGIRRDGLVMGYMNLDGMEGQFRSEDVFDDNEPLVTGLERLAQTGTNIRKSLWTGERNRNGVRILRNSP